MENTKEITEDKNLNIHNSEDSPEEDQKQDLELNKISIVDKNIEKKEDLNPIDLNNNSDDEASSPIQKIIKYIKSPVREDNTELIESLIDLSSSIESIGVEAHELTNLMNESEKIRLDMLKEKSKLGLNEEQYPIGTGSLSILQPIAFYNNENTQINKDLTEYTLMLEKLVLDSNIMQEVRVLHQNLLDKNIKPFKYIINKEQKKGYYKLIMGIDDDRVSRTELDFVINFLKTSSYANSKIIGERSKYYQAHLNNEDADFPNIKPLLEDVKKLKSILNVKLESIPHALTNKEKEHLKTFLPALDEYYKDQVAAFSGGKSYLPLAKNLANIQKTIKEKPVVKEIIQSSESLGFSMQRLYILHWVAESLMKNKYKSTLGISLRSHSQQSKTNSFDFLKDSVKFRNDIAHNGVVWNPDDFEKHIINYEKGIELISKEFNIDLSSFNLEKMNKPLSKEERKKEKIDWLFEKTRLDINLLKEIDSKLHKDFIRFPISKFVSYQDNIKRMERINDIVTAVEKEKVDFKKAYEIIKASVTYFYKNPNKNLDFHFISNRFKEKLCEDFFNLEKDNAVKILASKNNSNPKKIEGLFYALGQKYKQDILTSEDMRKINDLKEQLHG